MTLSAAEVRAAELVNKSSDYFAAGNLPAARLHALAALHVDANNPFALHNLSAILYQMELYSTSLSVARRALEHCDPKIAPHVKSNIGAALSGLRRHAEAQRYLRESIRALPNEAGPHHNLALSLYMTGNLNEALAEYDNAVRLQPDNVGFRSDRALGLLALGEIQNGLLEYECRWFSTTMKRSRFWDIGVPQWQGEPCNKLLVHHEQGFGDSLMLCRWIPALRAKCSHLTYVVPKQLVRVMQNSFAGIGVDVYDWDDPEIGVDYNYHIPLLSALRWLGVETGGEFPAAPYLHTEPSEISAALPKSKLRVGLCWASGDHGPKLRQRRRIVPLENFLPLSEIDGVRLVSLQKDQHSREIIDIGAEGIVFDLMNRCEDFADTASVIKELDLVISVDSAVVHLAGALGKPTIMLGPYTRCWRWWGGTTGFPWYKDMKILRQSANGSWATACAALVPLVKRAVSNLL